MPRCPIAGCILGTAVGDALGLPYEGVSRARAPRLLGLPERHRFLFGHGMVSDDTEHTCMVTQALIASGDDVDAFSRHFARRLRWWLVGFPAGVGKATVRACVKLWLGYPPSSSGVFSAGNGPAMRAAIIGVCFDDIERIVRYVRAASRITHSDPKAEYGAIAVALAALSARQDEIVCPMTYVERVSQAIGDEGDELVGLLRAAANSVAANRSTVQFAAQLGLAHGVTGYAYHTVPVVVHAWLSNPRDFRRAIASVIECGGDADTTAAILGGIVGTAVGEQGIPEEWLAGVCEWPRSMEWMRRLSAQLSQSLAHSAHAKPIELNPIAVLVRNTIFLAVVLYHGFRRLLPPY